MALTGTGLKEAIKVALEADGRQWTDAADAAWAVIGEAIVAYLVANAVVTTAVTTTGTAAAQTGTGVGGIS